MEVGLAKTPQQLSFSGKSSPSKSAKAKKKKTNTNDISMKSTRKTPEGNSILIKKRAQPLVGRQKSAKKLTPISSKKPQENQKNTRSFNGASPSLKKKSLKRNSSDLEDRIASSKKSRLSDVTDNSELNVSLDSDISKVSKKSKSGKKGKEVATNDPSWEQAVERARGMPDGEESSAEESDENDGETSKGKKSQSFEKGKKKPLNIINTAAKKLKQFADDKQKGTKRKLADTETEKKKRVDGYGLTKKERTLQRKVLKNNYEVSQRCKSLWEEIRRADCLEKKRLELCTELHSLVKGKASELMFCHDTSRVIQCLMKYALPEVKTSLFEELRDKIVEMCMSKYAKFFVRKLLKYGTKMQRDYVFRALYGKVRRLIKHKEAVEIVEVAYNDYANKQQRATLIEEFYGPCFVLFKTPDLQTLDEIVKSSPDKRNSILSNMKATLNVLISKTLLQHSIVHKVFLDYFTYAPADQRGEMIQGLRESVIHMLHTRDGSRVAMYCLWYGTAKDRKVIVKSMKTYVGKVCKEEYGHLVMLALLDTLDDTKMVQKVILEEMLKSVEEIAMDQYGRKVLLYLLSPRDPRHFHPDIVKVLEQGDTNPNSKKEMTKRRDELLAAVSQPLLDYVASNCKALVRNNAALMLVLVTLMNAKGNCEIAMKAICDIAGEPFVTGSPENLHIVEHPAGHLALKRLILSDRERIKNDQQLLFSEVLVGNVPEGSLKSWAACNRGCFTLVSLLDIERPAVTEKVQEELNPIKKSLSKLNFKGAQILMGKLKDI